MKFINDNGFSLLEVLLAMTILTIILIPMTGFVGNTTKLIKKTDLQQKALILGQQRMEELKTIPYDELEKESGRDHLTASDFAHLSVDGYRDFRRKVTVNKLPYINNMKEITVEVSWARGKQKIDLKTRVTKR